MTRFERLGQGLAIAAIVFFLAYPVRGFLFGPSPGILKLAWVGLLVAASLRPLWAPWLLIGLVPLAPIVPYLWRGVPYPLVHLIVIALALPLLVRWPRVRNSVTRDDIFLALGLFCVVALASAIVKWAAFSPFYYSSAEWLAELHRHLSGYAIEQQGRGLAVAVPALTILVDGLLAYLLVRDGLGSISPRRFLGGLAAIAIVVAALGVGQAFTGIGLRPWWQQFDPGILRLGSTYGDPNALAAFLALMLPILTGLAAAARRTPVRLAWLAGAMLVTAVLVMTGGRAGILAGGIGVAAGVGLGLWRGLDRDDPWPIVRRYCRPIYVGIGIAMLALLVTLTVVGTARDVRHSDQDSYLDMALFTLNLRQPVDVILKNRLEIWRIAGLMIRDNPTFGVGIGQFHGTFAVYNRQTQAFGVDVRLGAHNTFLNITAETGVTGLAIWLLVMALLFRAALRPGDTSEPIDIGWMRAGLAAGIMAYGLTMLTADRTVLREDLVILGSVAALVTVWSPARRRNDAFRTGLMLVASVLILLTVPPRVGAERRDLPMDRISFGLHPQEYDARGEPFRWTSERATFHVPADARTLVIPLRRIAPTEQTVRVRLDGRLVDELLLGDQVWRTVRYALPPTRDGRRFRRVELLVSPIWEPDTDGRRLGIMLGDYRWEP